MKRKALLGALGAAAGAAAAAPLQSLADLDRADLVLRGGVVYTGRRDGRVAEAMAVGGNRILAVGSRATIDGYIGRSTRVVNLRGGMVLPGIVDTHTHFASGSVARLQVALDDAMTPADVVKRIAAYARSHADQPWILGGNWQYDAFGPTGLPTKELLDAAVSDRPAALDSFDGHSLWANSRALSLAGITRATPDPTQNGVALGTIVRDPATGEPTGVLKEGAQQLVRRVIPAPSRASVMSALRGGMEAANARGVTGVINASGDLDEMALYETLHQRGLLTLRTTTAYSAPPGTRHTLSVEEMEAFEAARQRYGGDWVRAGIVKFFMDGVVETYTADMLRPYVGTTARGEPYYPAARYAAMLTELDRRGFVVMTHAIGDAAVRASLDGYQAVIAANGMRDRRWRIEHIEVCDPSDVSRFAQLGVIASMQPYHFCCPAPDGSDTWDRHLGAERWPDGFVWRDIADAGAVMVHGSDWPVVTIDPLIGIYSALTREDPQGNPKDGWFPKQRLTLDEAIAGYTRNAAYAAFMEDRTGTLEAGKFADAVVLDSDLRVIPPPEVLTTKIGMTLIDGKIVYEGDRIPDRTAELPKRAGGACACRRLAAAPV
ncbi:MAG: amidohydrolase [Candidatus Tumulicola sp.]